MPVTAAIRVLRAAGAAYTGHPYDPKIHINGGRRGFLVGVSPADLVRILSLTAVRVAV